MTRPETTERRRAARHAWALALAAMLGLAAHDAAAQQKPVVVVQSGEAATLDWHMHCDKNAHEPDRQIFDTLLRRNLKTLQLEGNLAESWKLLNDTTWQFKLRRNVKFHNGEPFDAAAVKFSIERMLNPQQAAPGKSASQYRVSMNCRPSASIPPQEGIASGTPRPRKERPASVRMAPATPNVATTMSDALTFGSTWRHTIDTSGTPSARAASTNAFSRVASVSARTTRA